MPLHVFRNTCISGRRSVGAEVCCCCPLATVFSLEFTAPAWTLLLAWLILRERMTPSRIGAVVLGLIGVLVIVRPGLATFQPAALLVLAAAIGFAATQITTKTLTRTDPTFAIVFWMNIIQAPLAYVASDPLFVAKLEVAQLPAILAIGTTGLASHYCLTNAFRAMPLDFMRIPLIAVVGAWLYGEQLDVFVFLGAGLIIAGILWNCAARRGRPLASRAVVEKADVARHERYLRPLLCGARFSHFGTIPALHRRLSRVEVGSA
jgi:drug/metabolite transporter (DMT)-like permease